MKAHIETLLQAEKQSRVKSGGGIMFSRTSENTIVVSCLGYNHNSLYELEEKLLKLGCRYDFSKCIQEYDKTCGRTFTHFIEPEGES